MCVVYCVYYLLLAAEEGEAEGTTPTGIDGTPHQKNNLFKTPLNDGDHTFSQEG